MSLEDFINEYGIGLTGGIACGKSTVAKILRELCYTVIDADELSRLAVLPGSQGLKQTIALLGQEVLNEDGTLNRALARGIIINDPDKRKALNLIIHPIIQTLLANRLCDEIVNLKADGNRYWFYEAPLLFETGNHKRFKSIWVATCPRKTQIKRLIERDCQSQKEALKLIKAQMDVKEKEKLADVVIDTNCTLEELKRFCFDLCWEKL